MKLTLFIYFAAMLSQLLRGHEIRTVCAPPHFGRPQGACYQAHLDAVTFLALSAQREMRVVATPRPSHIAAAMDEIPRAPPRLADIFRERADVAFRDAAYWAAGALAGREQLGRAPACHFASEDGCWYIIRRHGGRRCDVYEIYCLRQELLPFRDEREWRPSRFISCCHIWRRLLRLILLISFIDYDFCLMPYASLTPVINDISRALYIFLALYDTAIWRCYSGFH